VAAQGVFTQQRMEQQDAELLCQQALATMVFNPFLKQAPLYYQDCMNALKPTDNEMKRKRRAMEAKMKQTFLARMCALVQCYFPSDPMKEHEALHLPDEAARQVAAGEYLGDAQGNSYAKVWYSKERKFLQIPLLELPSEVTMADLQATPKPLEKIESKTIAEKQPSSVRICPKITSIDDRRHTTLVKLWWWIWFPDYFGEKGDDIAPMCLCGKRKPDAEHLRKCPALFKEGKDTNYKIGVSSQTIDASEFGLKVKQAMEVESIEADGAVGKHNALSKEDTDRILVKDKIHSINGIVVKTPAEMDREIRKSWDADHKADTEVEVVRKVGGDKELTPQQIEKADPMTEWRVARVSDLYRRTKNMEKFVMMKAGFGGQRQQRRQQEAADADAGEQGGEAVQQEQQAAARGENDMDVDE